MEESPPQTPRCRLCLTTFSVDSDQLDNLLDIFHDEDAHHFSHKIRDCTGVFISPEDTFPTTICTNCAETVHFIDEFRNLCRRVEERYKDLVDGVTEGGFDSTRWESYRHHVGVLRSLLPTGEEEDSLERNFGPMVAVKQEDDDGQGERQEVDVTFEWAEAEDMLEVKHEVDGDEGEDRLEEEEDEDVPKRKRAKVEVDQMSLAKAIHEHPVLWDSSNRGFHIASQRERAWHKLGAMMEVDKDQLKSEFNRLHDIYRRKRWNTDASEDELYQLLESMFSSRRVGKDRGPVNTTTEETSDERLQLAQILHEHEAIWDRSHAEYDKPTKWNKIAARMGMAVEELKHKWKGLRDVYHGRKRRLMTGSSDPENPILHEPLYVLLEQMVGDRKPKSKPPPSNKEEVMLDRMQLAKAAYEKEIIWNRAHPHYSNQVERESAFEELAAELDVSSNNLKQQWKRLRDFYRVRCARVMEGKLDLNDPQLREPLYLLLKKMLHDNMEVGKRSTSETPAEGEEPPAIVVQNDKLALAQAFREREFIWNRAHPQNATKVTREAAWKQAAKELNKSVADLKNQWRYLRDGYRVKWKRLQARPDDHTAIQATLNPLYQLMDQMFQEVPPPPPNQDQPKTEKGATSKTRRSRVSFNDDNRLQIANAINGQQILWNKAHPEYADYGKREQVWEQVAAQLDIPFVELKNQWKLLRDLYRGRVLRAASGKISPNHPFLRQKLFRLLDRMLRDNMKLGKDQALQWRKRPKKEKKEQGETVDGEEKVDELEFQDADGEEAEAEPERWGKPFENKELRARLAEEITKHEMLWNINHADYSRGSLRGQVWTEIGNQLGVDRSHAIMEWRRTSHRHRKQLELHGAVTPELLEQDPLHRMIHEVVYKAGEGDATAGDQPKKMWPPKRRYTGKKVYSDEGCFKVIQNGTTHYLRVCELCGKNVERSDFEYHMNRHNGLTPYACSYEGCDKRYGSKITRDRHEILVHTSDAERFECDQCGEKFKYRSKLEYHHAMNHKSLNFPCSICGKDKKHKQALRNHMRLHKDSGFACPVCGRVLQKKHTLDVHMRIHTNEKPYPCVLCGQSFRIKVLLKTHLAKVHNVAIEELEEPRPSGSGGR